MNDNKECFPMLTFKHFLDRPTWSAAAGYDFNFIDCMSVSATWHNLLLSLFFSTSRELPNITIVELPIHIAIIVSSGIAAFAWPFFFWLAAIPLWINCRRYKDNYQHGKKLNNTARHNLKLWIRNCDNKWNKAK